ncbi:BnaA01g27970D [Brassica napus]|uniref:BnaA01g27970D protein n=1 Tax=Brassica napus TaxID=3708 RepID=A0A078I9S3_BRANA|nr:BnaA01g27970D [Brassica napus]
MASWKKTIATPFKKAATLFNQPQQSPQKVDAKAREEHERRTVQELQGEVMACGYDDVLVMWSILDKSNSFSNLTS